MSPTKKPAAAVPPKELIGQPLTMRELAAALVKHYDIHEGKFDLTIEFQIGVGNVGRDAASRVPGAAIGISKVGLVKAKVDGPTTVDAAVVNPPKLALKARVARARAIS